MEDGDFHFIVIIEDFDFGSLAPVSFDEPRIDLLFQLLENLFRRREVFWGLRLAGLVVIERACSFQFGASLRLDQLFAFT